GAREYRRTRPGLLEMGPATSPSGLHCAVRAVGDGDGRWPLAPTRSRTSACARATSSRAKPHRWGGRSCDRRQGGEEGLTLMATRPVRSAEGRHAGLGCLRAVVEPANAALGAQGYPRDGACRADLGRLPPGKGGSMMMDNAVTLFRVAGIPVRVHASWLVVYGLLAWSLSVGYFPHVLADVAARTYWISGLVAALLLFVSVLLHELSHSVVARGHGLPVSAIT